MSFLQLYLLTRLPQIHDLFLFSAATVLILGFITLFTIGIDAALDASEASTKRFIIFIKYIAIIITPLAIGATMIPDRSDMAIIFASHWASNSEEVKKLPDNVVKTMNKFMDQYIQDKKDKDAR